MKNRILIQENTFEKAKKKVNENKGKEIIFTSNDDKLNRKVLEKLKINILLLNQKSRKDKQKQRSSGLNQVLAKIAKKNKIEIGINLDEIIKSKGKERGLIISHIKQNVRLCNKNKVKMKFTSKNKEKNSYELKALGSVLNMPTWMSKNF